ncbi:nuclear transport factor 2 family protein [Aurantimicrobium minutum]|uniref:nuclear transport factor 2 family protein n=1 Tax=Aurantimicrobium minutum TaxID=708131 RepID=UPI0024734EAF|nr:nuclear transport factor 2 family protein [Aurantimicrobium minutum]MDH6536112.1 ketosteroid isomerase-like protein [Aurantimicrobium minutum]
MSAESVIAAHYQAGAEGDVQGMFKDFAEDISWKESAGGSLGGSFTGMAEVIPGIFEKINAEWDGFGAVPEFLIADEATGRVAAICNYVGTHKTSGKAQQDVRVVHLWTVKNGKVVAFEQVCDTAQQNKFMN